MEMKTIRYWDDRTGEIISEKTVPTMRKQNGKDWMIMYDKTLMMLALNPSMTFADVRTYLFLCASVGWNCRYSTTKVALAETLGLSYPKMLESLKKLKKLDLIAESKENGQTFFALNPEHATKGRERNALLEEYNRLFQQPIEEGGDPFIANCPF